MVLNRKFQLTSDLEETKKRKQDEEEMLATGTAFKDPQVPLNEMTDPNAQADKLSDDINKSVDDLANRLDKQDEIKIKQTDEGDNAVLDGSEVTGGDQTKPKSILDGLTIEDIATMDSSDERAKKIEAELQRRRSIESISEKADPYLTKLGLSTIKEGEKTPVTVSEEAALALADRLLKGDKEYQNLGLAPGQELDNDRLTQVLSDKGMSTEQINAVIKARDMRLKEQRVSKDALTLIERKQKELDDRVAREQQDIETQVTRSMNILQRQRALRGVGLSTATESDIADIREKGDDLMNAARTKADNELALFRAEAEGAEADTISALRKQLSNSIDTLNKGLLEQVELENKLVAQGKVESEMAFNNLLETLKVGGIDVEGVDKFTSEATGVLSDKYGNPILVNGKTVPVGGNSSTDAQAIEQFAKDVSLGIDDISNVPSKYRMQVKARIAAGFTGDDQLSATQIGDARGLAKTIFGNTTKDSVNAVKALMLDGMSNDDIIERYRKLGYSEGYEGALKNGLENVIKSMPESTRDGIRDEFNERLADGDLNGAYSLLLGSAKDSVTSEESKQENGREGLLRNIAAIQDGLRALLETEEGKEAIETGKLTGKMEQVAQFFGSTTDERLAQIWSEIDQAIMSYRQSLSGAAFSESESKEYKRIFPSGENSIDLNVAKISALMNTTKRNIEAFYEGAIGPEYNDVFNQGALPHLFPTLGLTPIRGKEAEATQIQDEEQSQLDQIFGTTGGAEGTGKGEFTTSSGKKFNIDLSGFSSPDQTGGTKEIPQTGFVEQVNIARTGTNVAKDTNNPGNITADSIPSGYTKESYGKQIGATGTYLSPNGREYYVFPTVDSGTGALVRDLTAKISGNSRVIKPTDTLERFQRVYVGETSSGYLSTLMKITGANKNTQIKDIDANLLAKAVMKAEGFNS